MTDPTPRQTALAAPAWRIAVVGAGPAGLALALQAAQQLPRAEISLFDARPADQDVAADPRTLALALGSVQMLRRLGAWPTAGVQPITEVLVSQAPPTVRLRHADAAVRLSAADEGVPMLGAVLSYGTLVACLQQAWQAAEAAQPQRLHSRFGQPVNDVRPLGGPGAVAGGVEVDAGIAERFDLAVVAEGGVFAEQARKAVIHDYRQTAWVGTATLADATGLPVDLVDVGRAGAFLALEVVRGERVFCRDDVAADRFELYVLARAGDLLPFERERQRIELGSSA